MKNHSAPPKTIIYQKFSSLTEKKFTYEKMSVKILYISNDVAEIIRELKKFHKSTKDKRLVHKINALILLYKDYTYQKIEDALMLDERTIRRYRDIYQEMGIDELIIDSYKGGFSKLSEVQQKQLVEDIEENLFLSISSQQIEATLPTWLQ
jgi:hypothetical protein